MTPPELVPEIAPYTIMLDAASKSFAATGMRVGWAVMPPAARQRMADILGHVGAWAPKAEQVAMAALLDDEPRDRRATSAPCEPRSGAPGTAGRGFEAMRRDGLPVEVIPPQGAIYLSVRLVMPGKHQRTDPQAAAGRGGLRGGPLSGLRAEGGQRLVSHLGRRGLARGHRRRAPPRAGGAGRALVADSVEPRPGPAPRRRRARGAAVVALALTLRVGLFPFAENKQGDAPMRALIAERMNLDPHAAADPRSYCQFGPLHIEAMRPFMALDPDARRSSRYLSLLAGMAVFLPFLRLARRICRARARAVAALALAVSPLHIQPSITASSEALYLLLMVTCLERLQAALAADGPRRSRSPDCWLRWRR